MCRIFDCDRRWVEKFIRPHVRHILVTYFFRQYILEQFRDSLEDHEQEDLASAFYFYSMKDLRQFWNSTATAQQKKKIVDLGDYLDPGSTPSMLLEEQRRHSHTKRSTAEESHHMDIMESLLSSKGFSLYAASKYGKSSWHSVPLPELQNKSLLTMKRIMRQKGFHTDGTAYKYLIGAGAVRLKFGGKTYWQVEEHSGRWLVAVPIQEEAPQAGK